MWYCLQRDGFLVFLIKAQPQPDCGPEETPGGLLEDLSDGQAGLSDAGIFLLKDGGAVVFLFLEWRSCGISY